MRVRQGLLAAVVLAAAFLSLTGSAVARGGIDRSFGNEGVLELRPGLSGYQFQSIREMVVGPEGGIYLLAVGTNCSGPCSSEVYVLRRNRDGSRDGSYAGGRGAALVSSSSFPNPALGVDGRGRVVVAYGDEQGLHLTRLMPDGSFDTSFGTGGRSVLPCDCGETQAEIRVGRRGGILFIGNKLEQTRFYPAAPAFHRRLILAHVLPDGSLAQGLGEGGWASTIVPEGWSPRAIAANADGSVLLAGNTCCRPEGISVLRITPEGAVDGAFAAKVRAGLASLRRPPRGAPNDVAAIVRRSKGRFDVLGGTASGGFVLRFHRNGSLDRQFGRRGWQGVRWQIQQVARVDDGRLFAAGYHPKVDGTVAFALLSSGRVDRSYVGKWPFVLKAFESPSASLAMQGRRPLLFDPGYRGCRGYCPPEPKLARFKPIGR